jgi:predicted DNA-binding transcriptional regulator YafY
MFLFCSYNGGEQMNLKKYIGQTIVIIYQGSGDKFTKRRVQIRAVGPKYVKAYCHDSNAPRTFRLDGILAVEPDRRAV